MWMDNYKPWGTFTPKCLNISFASHWVFRVKGQRQKTIRSEPSPVVKSVSTHMCSSVYMYIYIYLHIYVHIYIYIYM